MRQRTEYCINRKISFWETNVWKIHQKMESDKKIWLINREYFRNTGFFIHTIYNIFKMNYFDNEYYRKAVTVF